MQPSMFNVRVPLDERGDEVFLMNTLTDAQLIVSPDVAALLDRVGARTGSRSTRRRARGARPRWPRTASSSTSREDDRAGARPVSSQRSANDTTELHVTVLTTLQCNFACDYCFQGDHGDYNKFADEDDARDGGARRRRGSSASSTACGRRSFVLTLLRRRAAAEPAGHVLPGRAAVAGAAGSAACSMHDQHHHQRPAADAGGRRSAAAVRPERREDHARRRPRHAQPDAAAARRPGHLRSDHREHPRRSPASAGSRSAATSTRARSTAIPALLDFLREQEFADKLAQGQLQADHPRRRRRRSRRACISADPPVERRAGKPLGGTCMTSAGAGGGSSAATRCDFLDEKMTFLRDETQRRGFPTPDGVHMGPCHVHMRARAHDRSRRLALRVPRLHRRDRRCRPATSTTGRTSGAQTRRSRFDRLAAWKRVRRLRVHPRLCRRLLGRVAHRAWRHEQADMSQAQLRIRCRIAGARCGRGFPELIN